WLMDAYMAVLRWSLVHRWKTMMIGVAAFIATIVAFYMLPMTFQPTTNTDYSQVRREMTPGTTLEQPQAVAQEVSQLLRKQPEVDAAFPDLNVADANIFITLKKDRKR